MWYIPVYDRLHVFETIVSQEKWLYIIFPWNINLTWADLQTRICLAIYHFQSLSEWSKRTRVPKVLHHKSVLLFYMFYMIMKQLLSPKYMAWQEKLIFATISKNCNYFLCNGPNEFIWRPWVPRLTTPRFLPVNFRS